MKTKGQICALCVLILVLSAAVLTMAQTASKSDAVAAITKLENDSVKADLANDKVFYGKVLADDWTGGDSEGAWFTKTQMMKLMDDPQHNNTKSEKLSELKVRAYGDTAIANYKDTYEGSMNGEHRATTVIATDTFVKMGGEWKLVASHACKAK